jgi:hypothetical protein
MVQVRVSAAAAENCITGVCSPAQLTQRQTGTLGRSRVSPWQGFAMQAARNGRASRS